MRPCLVKGLVLDFVLLLGPSTETRKSLLAHKVLTRNGAVGVRLGDLVVNKRVIEIDRLGIVLRLAIDDALDACPLERTQAHRTRLARGIAGAPRQLEVLLLGASRTDSTHLGVCSRIIV